MVAEMATDDHFNNNWSPNWSLKWSLKLLRMIVCMCTFSSKTNRWQTLWPALRGRTDAACATGRHRRPTVQTIFASMKAVLPIHCSDVFPHAAESFKSGLQRFVLLAESFGLGLGRLMVGTPRRCSRRWRRRRQMVGRRPRCAKDEIDLVGAWCQLELPKAPLHPHLTHCSRRLRTAVAVEEADHIFVRWLFISSVHTDGAN